MTFDVFTPPSAKRRRLLFMVSGGWVSDLDRRRRRLAPLRAAAGQRVYGVQRAARQQPALQGAGRGGRRRTRRPLHQAQRVHVRR